MLDDEACGGTIGDGGNDGPLKRPPDCRVGGLVISVIASWHHPPPNPLSICQLGFREKTVSERDGASKPGDVVLCSVGAQTYGSFYARPAANSHSTGSPSLSTSSSRRFSAR